MMYDLIVIGGGAAGIFASIRYAEFHPNSHILILEKKERLLEKVKVSGGGRCNVTHNWNDPKEASNYYPRGSEFLQHAFKKFHCSDMVHWLHKKGIKTKVEEDGRIFPSSDSSQTIIDCFLRETKKHHITIKTKEGIEDFSHDQDVWQISTSKAQYLCTKILFATGSNRKIWDILQQKGHQIVAPIPSLFTFRYSNNQWNKLAGISVNNAAVKIKGSNEEQSGPLLITHRGFSGPAILRLSAWEARELEHYNYKFELNINWLGISQKQCLKTLKEIRDSESKKNPANLNPFQLPKRLNQLIFSQTEISTIKMAEIGNKQLLKWADILCNSSFNIEGKSTNKEEFVTAGGIYLHEVNPETMESKILSKVYFAGEILDIDAITGGFNFQACWSAANLFAFRN